MGYSGGLWAERSDCSSSGYVVKRYRVINRDLERKYQNKNTHKENEKMTIGIVKCIAFAIAISILYGVLGYLNRKKATVGGRMQSDTQYAVRIPSALKYVYMAMFLLGIALFLIFLAFKVSGNESVTMGHFYFSLVFAGIGLLVMVWASRWSIIVTGASMEIHGLLHKKSNYPCRTSAKWKSAKRTP